MASAQPTRDDPAEALELARRHDLEVAPGELDALWQRVSADTVAAPRSFVTRLRELPTPTRVGFVLLGTLLLAGLTMMLIGGVRGDLVGGSLVARYAAALVGLTVLAGAVFAVALRGAHQRPLGWVGWALVALGVLVPLGLSFTPAVWSDVSPPAEAIVNGCAFIGVATGVFAGILAWLFQRQTTPVAVRLLASAAGGGIIAFAMLQLHCPADSVDHLVIGHSSVGLLLVAFAAIGLAVRRMIVGRRA
ncbi:MAG: hypothetical protein IT385_21575 [Deltaproteobacteria bacterium]|nr:hypothetical protein [Deltaproteobacteria bacterium]